jgi:hypothetical protein
MLPARRFGRRHPWPRPARRAIVDAGPGDLGAGQDRRGVSQPYPPVVPGAPRRAGSLDARLGAGTDSGRGPRMCVGALAGEASQRARRVSKGKDEWRGGGKPPGASTGSQRHGTAHSPGRRHAPDPRLRARRVEVPIPRHPARLRLMPPRDEQRRRQRPWRPRTASATAPRCARRWTATGARRNKVLPRWVSAPIDLAAADRDDHSSHLHPRAGCPMELACGRAGICGPREGDEGDRFHCRSGAGRELGGARSRALEQVGFFDVYRPNDAGLWLRHLEQLRVSGPWRGPRSRAIRGCGWSGRARDNGARARRPLATTVRPEGGGACLTLLQYRGNHLR